MGVLVRLWTIALVVRLLNAATVSTYFVPDEFWQAQEVAYSLVFGTGYRSWEWIPASTCDSRLDLDQVDWKSALVTAARSGPLRSIIPVLLYVPPYYVVRLLGLDSPWLVGLAPRLAQALLAAVGDAAAAATASAAVPSAGPTAFVLCLLSPWLWFTSTRTLANSTEAVLVLVALYAWPLNLGSPRRRERPFCSLLLASLTLLVRPSTGVLWAYMGIRTLVSAPNPTSALAFFLTSITVVTAVLGTSVVIDSVYHGELAVPILSFGTRNVLQGLATFYGTAPWHFYLTQALPLLGGAPLWYALRAVYSIYFTRASCRSSSTSGDPALALVVVEISAIYLLLHSVLGHKEHRFVQPLAYLVPILASCYMVQSSTGAQLSSRTRHKVSLRSTWRSFSLPLCWTLVVAAMAGVYLTSFHQRGQYLVVQDVARLARSAPMQSVGWLMPCHSTPWQASLHTPWLSDVQLGSETARRSWFLTCSPPQSCTSEGFNPKPPSGQYVDLADEFYLSPVEWLQQAMASKVDPTFPPAQARLFRTPRDPVAKIPWPSHLVLFGGLRSNLGVENALSDHGYHRVSSRWNAPVTDERRSGQLEIWAWQPPQFSSR